MGWSSSLNAELKPGLYKPCAICKGLYRQYSSLQRTCGDSACQAEMRRQRDLKKARKAKRVELREWRERSKSIGKRLQEAQEAFNAWIRWRDRADGCISCGAMVGKVNAGHFRPAGANAALRFDGANVHRQCERCNSYLSGNLSAYREGLIKKIGLREVERLEGPQPAVKWNADELILIKNEYRRRLREAKRE